MDIVIVEDEKPAAEKLLNALQQCDTSIRVNAVLNSVAEAIDWF